MKDDIEKYMEEEQALSTADKKERIKILVKRHTREKRSEFLNSLHLYVLFLFFMSLLAISFGWTN